MRRAVDLAEPRSYPQQSKPRRLPVSQRASPVVGRPQECELMRSMMEQGHQRTTRSR